MFSSEASTASRGVHSERSSCAREQSSATSPGWSAQRESRRLSRASTTKACTSPTRSSRACVRSSGRDSRCPSRPRISTTRCSCPRTPPPTRARAVSSVEYVSTSTLSRRTPRTTRSSTISSTCGSGPSGFGSLSRPRSSGWRTCCGRRSSAGGSSAGSRRTRSIRAPDRSRTTCSRSTRSPPVAGTGSRSRRPSTSRSPTRTSWRNGSRRRAGWGRRPSSPPVLPVPLCVSASPPATADSTSPAPSSGSRASPTPKARRKSSPTQGVAPPRSTPRRSSA